MVLRWSVRLFLPVGRPCCCVQAEEGADSFRLLAGGLMTPAQLRAIGEISNRFGRGDGELSTRQNVQLHWIELAALPDVFEALHAAGLTSAGACGDTVRNITGCPVAGLAPDEAF